MKERERKGGPVFLLFVVLLVLIGCTREVIEYRDVVIGPACSNNTIIEYINITKVMACNDTPEMIEVCEDGTYSRKYVLALIRQLKRMERTQNLYFNDSECNDDLNKTEIKLKDCERELCYEWNSSWC